MFRLESVKLEKRDFGTKEGIPVASFNLFVIVEENLGID